MTARVRWWQKRLGLNGWDIKVQFGKMDDGADAACMASPEYRSCVVHFDLEKIPPETLDAYVSHEVTHALCWSLANAAHSMAGGDKSKEEWVRTEEESLVTALEGIFIRWIKEPKRPKRKVSASAVAARKRTSRGKTTHGLAG